MASEEEEDFDELKSESSLLTPYAVEVHYPEFEEPRIQDAKQAIELASRIEEFVKEKLPGNF